MLRQIILAHAGRAGGTGQEYVELEDLSKWVSKVLPDTKFWVKFDRLRDRYIDVKFLTPEMRVHGQGNAVSWKSIDMAGTGFLQIVQIFSYILYFKPKLLLIDEPDAHLHPGRQQLLIRALESAAEEFPDTQIILTTHSPNLVRGVSSKATINWIDQGKVRANGSVVRQRMGWGALDKDLIIFSEDGNTENLMNILNQWPPIAQKCTIWPTFGKDSIPDGRKISTLRRKFGINILVHRDRDFMSAVDVEDWCRFKMFDDNNVPVWVTSKSDIEGEFCSLDQISLLFGVNEKIADELLMGAMYSITEEVCMQEFSNAYSDVINKLPKKENRNAIARWNDLGKFSINTMKGKTLLGLVKKSCSTVLPSHGMGQLIGRRNDLTNCLSGNEICVDLRDLIESSIV